MIPESSGLVRQCPGPPLPKAAAIVDWFGISDVAELLDGPNERDYAVAWLGSRPERAELARRISPLTYVRAGQPPVFIIHGTADPMVPYAQAIRLHEALDRAGVKNQLFSVANGKHGHFDGARRSEFIPQFESSSTNVGLDRRVPLSTKTVSAAALLTGGSRKVILYPRTY